MNAFYGNPDANGDGVVDPKWYAANIVRIVPPYPMVWSWDNTPVKAISIHKLCAQSCLRALETIGKKFTDFDRAHYQLNRCGGAFNFRLKRGGSTLSNHSWGSALDLAPELNGLGVKYGSHDRMMPMGAVDAFKAEGWEWGGLWGTADAMHVQAARL